MRIARWLGVGLIVTLAGCAQVAKQAFNREAAKDIRSVAIVQPENQERYEAIVLGHPGQSFGLIGSLIAAADMQLKSNRLTEAIDVKETRLQERVTQKLRAGLTKAGYDVQLVLLPKDTPEDQLVAAVKRSANVDAILIVTVIGRYLAAGATTDYFPHMVVKVRKVDTRNERTLYEDTFTYGYVAPQAQTVHFASDASYRFGTIELLIADPARTREGLLAGIDAVVEQIAADLKRN